MKYTVNGSSNKLSRKKLAIFVIGITLIIAIGISVSVLFLHKKPKVSITRPVIAAIVKKPVIAPVFAAAESGLLPWHLTTGMSRMAVFNGTGSQLVIAGGLESSGTTSSVYTLDTTNGSQVLSVHTQVPVHDTSSAIINGNMEIFGGGSANSVNSVQSMPASSLAGFSTTSTLPDLRSDSTAVSIGNTSYIIGGYNGVQADPQVLETTDGKVFNSIGDLPIPVRYTTAAYINGLIYVFGGMAINGPNAGNPINSVQIINPVNHQITVAAWKLPEPLEAASAMVLNNELFIAGGQTNTLQPINVGIGTTQVSGISTTGSDTSGAIWAVDTVNGKFLNAGVLQAPVSNAGVAVIGSTAWLIGGENNNNIVSTVQIIKPNTLFGIAGTPGAGSPYYGDKLLIADRGNNRLLVLNDQMNIIWNYPSSSTQPNSQLYYPDDAFFTNNGTQIISNQEDNNTIIKIAYPSGKIIWSFGHPLIAGTANGYLHDPDDAYQLTNGQIVVADINNCRLLFINPNGTIANQIGTNGVCKHDPPNFIGTPNGSTPLYDGNILVSEIHGSWVSEYTPQGKLVWSTHLAISYPSDPQQISASPTNNPNLYLIADYAMPGSILTFNRAGQILSRYHPTSGPGMLNHPSLVELLPSGVYMANDDLRNRMVAIDPATGALVWQYGVSDVAGTKPGMLNTVDGFDILSPNGSTPTHGASG